MKIFFSHTRNITIDGIALTATTGHRHMTIPQINVLLSVYNIKHQTIDMKALHLLSPDFFLLFISLPTKLSV